VAVLAVAVPTILTPFAAGMQNDADDAQQAVATTLAAEMMDEVLSKPFSDPEGASMVGPEKGEQGRPEFDNIDDYDDYAEAAGKIADAFGQVMSEPEAEGLSRLVETDYIYVNGQLTSEDPSFVRVTVTVLDGKEPVASLVRLCYDLPEAASVPGTPPEPEMSVDFVLLSTAGTALSISGNGQVNLQGRGYVHSSSCSAVRMSGNAKIVAEAIDIVGNYKTSGNAKIVAEVTTGNNSIPTDPYGTVPEPNQSDYTTQSTKKKSIKDKNVTLQPGVYKGGLSFDGNAVVTMAPGVYYLDNGGFDIKGNARVEAEGVMIYLNSGEKVSMAGNGKINWTPPDSGDYEGLSIFYGRNVSETLSITGNGGMKITGAVYGVKIDVKLAGNGSMDILGGAYVVNEIEIKGNGDLSLGHPDARQ
jgi:hypothetical protein